MSGNGSVFLLLKPFDFLFLLCKNTLFSRLEQIYYTIIP